MFLFRKTAAAAPWCPGPLPLRVVYICYMGFVRSHPGRIDRCRPSGNRSPDGHDEAGDGHLGQGVVSAQQLIILRFPRCRLHIFSAFRSQDGIERQLCKDHGRRNRAEDPHPQELREHCVSATLVQHGEEIRSLPPSPRPPPALTKPSWGCPHQRVWNQSFNFPITKADTRVNIELWEDDGGPGKDDYIGTGSALKR